MDDGVDAGDSSAHGVEIAQIPNVGVLQVGMGLKREATYAVAAFV